MLWLYNNVISMSFQSLMLLIKKINSIVLYVAGSLLNLSHLEGSFLYVSLVSNRIHKNVKLITLLKLEHRIGMRLVFIGRKLNFEKLWITEMSMTI